MSSSSPSKQQQQQPKYQPLHHARLDGTDNKKQQPQPQPNVGQGYNNNNEYADGYSDDRPRTSLTEPLLSSSSSTDSFRNNNNMNDEDYDTYHIHDPLLSQYSSSSSNCSRGIDTPHVISSTLSSTAVAAAAAATTTTSTDSTLSPRNSHNKKVVRFNNTDIIVESSSSDRYINNNNNNNNNIKNNQLRQRNTSTSTITGTSTNTKRRGLSTTTTTTTATTTATSTYGGRLLNRYYNHTNIINTNEPLGSWNNSNSSSSTSSSSNCSSNVTIVPPQPQNHSIGGGSLWNVKHIHYQKFHQVRTYENDDMERNGHSNDVYDAATTHDEDHDIHNNTVTQNNHRTSHQYRNCSCCYEFWNTWFYTLAYQRTVVLILILFTTYTCIVVFYAMLYFMISRIGQSIHNDHPTVMSPHQLVLKIIPITATTTTTTTTLSEDPNQYHVGSNNHTTNHTSHTNTTTSQMISILLLNLFCDMDLHTPMEALYFSLSTMASIGYGVSDYYFGNCGIVPLLIVLLQICTAICYDAVAIGLLFQRLRRSHKRSKSIWMTNTAVIQRIQMIPYFMIRIAELRHYPLVNATIRAYCIYHDHYPIHNNTLVNKDDTMMIDQSSTTSNTGTTTIVNHHTNHIQTSYYVTKPMILQQHDILMNIPQVIVHPIRMHESPLCPPSKWYDRDGIQHTYRPPITDPLYTTTNDHISSISIKEDTEQIQLFMQDRNMEIVIVIEGTDELTGTCTQTKQSYTYPDIQWNANFVPCMYPAASSTTTTTTARVDPNHRAGGCIVDFATFHSVEAAPLNSEYCPYV